MTIPEILTAAHTVGVWLEAQGDRLHVEAPHGVLTADLRTTLVARKPELLAVLWRLQAMRRHGIDRTPDRRHLDRPPIAVAKWPGTGAPGRCFSCGEALEHPAAYGRCAPCEIAAEIFYATESRPSGLLLKDPAWRPRNEGPENGRPRADD